MKALSPLAKNQGTSLDRSRSSADKAGDKSFLPETRTFLSQASGTLPNSITRIPLAPLGHPLMRKLAIGETNDPLEAEADRMAERVLRMTDPSHAASAPSHTAPTLRRKCSCEGSGTKCKECEEAERGKKLHRKPQTTSAPAEAPPIVHDVLRSPGQPLDTATRAFFEPRFGADFSRVRVHTDARASESARSVNAMAYAVGSNVVFKSGTYCPHAPEGRKLLAHELAHVVQQGLVSPSPLAVRRIVELRPPGRGEASAFDRRDELIDRMNDLSPAVLYSLNGNQIAYDVVDPSGLTPFDRQMIGFVDRPELVPLRLITSKGLVGDRASGFQTLLIDSFAAGYLDMDDMKASDDTSFQMNLIHLLTERFRVRNYARRIGTNFSDAEFQRAHQAGLDAETQYLRDTIGDPTIRFIFEEQKPDTTVVFGYRSAEGYRIFHVFLRSSRAVSGGHVFVQTRDNRRLSIDDFIAERNVAAAASGAAGAGAAAAPP